MVLYNPGKDMVDLTTTKQNSKDDDDLDKQALSKRFKIMHLIPSKPQSSVKQFTDQLFGTTSSKYSPTPLREPTPPRDLSKGKAAAIIEEPTTLKAQAQKWTEHEAKKAKIMEEYNHQISFRADVTSVI
ncbi:hypothetical protein Tco_0636285 [Tanacetum coccineum]